MPAKRDISHLPPDEQAKIERRRSVSRRSAERCRRGEARIPKTRDQRLKEDRDRHAARLHLRDREGFNHRMRQWRKSNPEMTEAAWRRQYEKDKGDPQRILSRLLRARLSSAICKDLKTGSAVRDLGCTSAELAVYIESKFLRGMTWENRGRYGWHIDHIKPLASFDLTDREQFLEACHYTNLQPLWWRDNLSKGAKCA